MMANWMRTLRAATIVLTFGLCFALLGCGKSDDKGKGGAGGGDAAKVTKANYDKLKEKMSEKDVTDILGPPGETKDGQGGAKEFIWKNGNNRITVGMKDGKVDYLMSQFVN